MELKVIKQKVLQANEDLAEKSRLLMRERRCLMVNLISSPGSGKTSLLERIVPVLLANGVKVAVIEGDCYSTRDGERVQRLGVPVIQINTEGDCHLEASTVHGILSTEVPVDTGLLFVENVGNLVCPAVFDLGEKLKVSILSVPEGSDKPVKYPLLFRESGLVVLNKIDLAQHTNFNRPEFYGFMKDINPACRIIEASCTSGEGIGEISDFFMALLKSG
jgi:hydrogenase nickel incorporation protein HypB